MGTAMLRNKYLCSPLPLSTGQAIFGGFLLAKQCPERVPALQPRGVTAVVQPSPAPQRCPQTSGGLEDSSEVLADSSHFRVGRHITIAHTESVFLSRAGCWEKPDSSSQLPLYKQGLRLRTSGSYVWKAFIDPSTTRCYFTPYCLLRSQHTAEVFPAAVVRHFHDCTSDFPSLL